MITLTCPTERALDKYLAAHRNSLFTYNSVGATCRESPAGFDVDRHRVFLGHGRGDFERAKQALRAWKMIPAEIGAIHAGDAPLAPGAEVALLLRTPLVWWTNAARIIYTFDGPAETSRIERFGFAYGTLDDHVECGEERFSVEWRADDDSVWYELVAFSRPRHWLAWLGYYFVRWQQARFRRLSGIAMQRAVNESDAFQESAEATPCTTN
jgi:uncharacterized protein (UPF0548 family)